MHKHTFKRSNFVFTCLGKIKNYVAVAKILYKTPKKAITQQVWDQQGEFPEQFVFFVKGKALPVNKFHSPREANMLRPNENTLKNQNSHFTLSLATKHHNSNLLFQCKTGQCLYNKKMTFAVLCLQMCCRHNMAVEFRVWHQQQLGSALTYQTL